MKNSKIYNGGLQWVPILLIGAVVSAFTLPLFGQQKGVQPTKKAQNLSSQNTYALVIGISQYKDNDIPDLQFADRDALAFIEYLRSDAGGHLKEEQIQYLLNEDATTGSIVERFDWLIEACKPGDRAIVYFSGHSDVESVTKNQRGFLLTHDTPSRSYIAGGFALIFLNDIISTLADNDVKVVVISDACRAGKLAGSTIGGPQYTSAFLAKQFVNEIKILACQADEFSLEGKEWGGGRGLFSYHLINGLYGQADENNDKEIKLIELDRYLEKEVAAGAEPLQQNPITVGNRNEVLTQIKDPKPAGGELTKNEPALFYDIAVRAFETQLVNAHADTAVAKWYRQFVEKVESSHFLKPENDCAEHYFQKLLEQDLPEKFISSITRFYAAKLQDGAQEVLLRILNDEIVELSKRRIDVIRSYAEFPTLLARAADLLGESHYMYDNLKSRQYFFEGLIEWNIYYLSAHREKEAEILRQFTTALSFQPNAPHVLKYLGLVHATMTNQLDSAQMYMDRATNLAPTWISPYYSLAYILARQHGQFEQAQKLLDKAGAIDSTHLSIAVCRAAIDYYNQNFESARLRFEEVLASTPDNTTVLHNLGNTCINLGRLDEAETYHKRAAELEPQWCDPHFSLGFLYAYFERYDEAITELVKANEADPYFVAGRKKLGVVYYRTKKYAEAEAVLLDAYRLAPEDAEINYNLACLSSIKGDVDKAIKYLTFVIGAEATDYEEIMGEVDFENLKKSEAFDTLMQRHFPNDRKE